MDLVCFACVSPGQETVAAKLKQQKLETRERETLWATDEILCSVQNLFVAQPYNNGYERFLEGSKKLFEEAVAPEAELVLDKSPMLIREIGESGAHNLFLEIALIMLSRKTEVYSLLIDKKYRILTEKVYGIVIWLTGVGTPLISESYELKWDREICLDNSDVLGRVKKGIGTLGINCITDIIPWGISKMGSDSWGISKMGSDWATIRGIYDNCLFMSTESGLAMGWGMELWFKNCKVVDYSHNFMEMGRKYPKTDISSHGREIKGLEGFNCIMGGWFEVGYDDDAQARYSKALEGLLEPDMILYYVIVSNSWVDALKKIYINLSVASRVKNYLLEHVKGANTKRDLVESVNWKGEIEPKGGNLFQCPRDLNFLSSHKYQLGIQASKKLHGGVGEEPTGIGTDLNIHEFYFYGSNIYSVPISVDAYGRNMSSIENDL